MAQHYGLSVEDTFGLSWRRFVVLFRGIFSWNDDEDSASMPDISGSVPPDPRSKYKQAVREARGADARISKSLDWDRALGKAPAEKKETITTEEFLRGLRHG